MQDCIFMKIGYVIMFLCILIPCIENCMDNCQIMTFNGNFSIINTSSIIEYMLFVVPTWFFFIKTQYAKLMLQNINIEQHFRTNNFPPMSRLFILNN
jgi:hypothetical protein